MKIESIHNERIKRVRRLYTRRMRARTGLTVIEGIRLIEEALHCAVEVEDAFFAPELLPGQADRSLLRSLERVMGRAPVQVPASILRLLADTEHPQGIVAVIRIPKENDWRDALLNGSRMLLLDRLQDPTNLGTVLRSALSFDIDALFCLHGTADVFAPKVLRGSMGAAFRLQIHQQIDYRELRPLFQERPLCRIASVVKEGAHPKDMPWHEPWLLALGNEAAGLHEEILADCGHRVTIPMPGGMESLNVAMAATILLYESQRNGS